MVTLSATIALAVSLYLCWLYGAKEATAERRERDLKFVLALVRGPDPIAAYRAEQVAKFNMGREWSHIMGLRLHKQYGKLAARRAAALGYRF